RRRALDLELFRGIPEHDRATYYRVATRSLGGVQRTVGHADERFRPQAVLGEARNTTGDCRWRQLHVVTRDVQRCQAFPEFVGTGHGARERAVGEYDGNLLAAIPAGHIGAAEQRQHGRTHRLYDGIARFMSVSVVEELEVVDVEVQERNRGVRA